MKVELKNVKYAEFASDETNCFEASIYIDGKRTGTVVSNEGRGGSNMYHGGDAYERLTAYAKTLPEIVTNMTLEGKPFTIQPDADTIIDDLMNAWLDKRDLKRMCAGKTVFRIPGETYREGEYHTMKNKFSGRVKDHLVARYGQSVFILNETL